MHDLLNQPIRQVELEIRAAEAEHPIETPLAMQIVEVKQLVRATLVKVSPKAMHRHNQSHLVAPIITGQGSKVAVVNLRAAAVAVNALNQREALRISTRLEVMAAAMFLGRAAVTKTTLAGGDLVMTMMMISRTSLMMKTTLGPASAP